jgi:uncharacterized Zn ribbon protein
MTTEIYISSSMAKIIEDIKNKTIADGDTIILCEGKERKGMSSLAMLNNIYLKQIYKNK